MSIKTILAPITDLPQAQSTLETAFLVAHRFGGHVVGLHVRPAFKKQNLETIMELASLSTSSPVLRDAIGDTVRLEDEDALAARQLFEETCRAMQVRPGKGPAGSGVSAAYKEIAGDGPEAIAEHARVFDLVVASQPKNDPGHRLRETLRAILFHSGRPVLSVPDRTPPGVGETILIAWNRSALSARAAAIARQHFERAGKVGVLSVRAEHGGGPSAQDLVDYLAWHGIQASLIEAELHKRRLGDVILDEAAAFGADLLVMGAYSLSPFRESLTRGVTNHILSHAELPVLMTH